MEEWRVIPEAPDYSVSRTGRVRRDKPDWQGKYAGRILKPSTHRRGYLAHILCTKEGKITRKVHRLVCEAFNGPPPEDRPHCAHRDGDNQNNTPENLYWATAKENCADRDRHGRTAGAEQMKGRTLCTGDRHWTRRHPEKVLRGDAHPRRLRPEIVPRGASNSNAKLTEQDAKDILAAPQYYGVGRELANKYGVSMGLITAIRKGRAWAHLSRPK